MQRPLLRLSIIPGKICYSDLTMGEIKVKVWLENVVDSFLRQEGKISEKQVKKIEVESLVDTGAVLVLLSQDLAETLGLPVRGKSIVALANEEKIELNRSTVVVTICGRETTTDCLIGPPGCESLIGQIVLESLDLIVDPLKQTVTPRPESPYLPTLKMK